MTIVIALAVFSQWRYVRCSLNHVPPFDSEDGHVLVGKRWTLILCSGNGLVSYYIHLILQGVGVTEPTTQGAINGGLQVIKTSHARREHH